MRWDGSGIRKFHVGRSGGGDLDGAVEFFLDETRQLDDRAFWNKVRDIATAAVTPASFQRIVSRYREAAGVKIEGNPIEVVEAVAKRFGLVEAETGGVLWFLVEGGDLSKWGLCNAVTRLSQEVTISYERATDLERVGGQIIELPPTEWKILNNTN